MPSLIGLACRICGNETSNRAFVAREMMFGLGDEYEYLECASCGGIQILNPPSEPRRLYPPGYYSLTDLPRPSSAPKRLLQRARLRYATTGRGILGRALTRRWGPQLFADWVRRSRVEPGMAVLDIGCGQGELLVAMADAGFSDLTGVDPFIDVEGAPNVRPTARGAVSRGRWRGSFRA